MPPRPELIWENPNPRDFRNTRAHVPSPPMVNANSGVTVATVSLSFGQFALSTEKMEALSKAAHSRIIDDGDAMPPDDLTDAKLAAVEARTDTKIVRMEGKLDLVLSKVDGINSRLNDVHDDYRATRANQWVIGLGLAVLIIAVAALLPVFFSVGTQVRDLVHSEVQSQMPTRPQLPN